MQILPIGFARQYCPTDLSWGFDAFDHTEEAEDPGQKQHQGQLPLHLTLGVHVRTPIQNYVTENKNTLRCPRITQTLQSAFLQLTPSPR